MQQIVEEAFEGGSDNILYTVPSNKNLLVSFARIEVNNLDKDREYARIYVNDSSDNYYITILAIYVKPYDFKDAIAVFDRPLELTQNMDIRVQSVQGDSSIRGLIIGMETP